MSSRLLVALAVVAVSASAAQAETAVIVGGTAREELRDVVSKSFTDELARAGWSLASGVPRVTQDAILHCLDEERSWPCIEPHVSVREIDRLVIVTVLPDDNPADVVVVARLVVADAEPTISRNYCVACTAASIDVIARELSANIIKQAERLHPAAIEVRSTPPGASITIDRRPAGVAPRKVRTTPGSHRVVVELAGYVTQSHDVTVEAGARASLDVELLRERRASAGPSTALPLVLMVAGGAALAGGVIVSLRVDPPPDGQPQPRYLYSSTAIGVAVAGGVAVAVGVYLLARTRSSAPTAVATNGGAIVGWVRAF